MGHSTPKGRAHWEHGDEETGHDHTHVVFELDQPVDLENERRMDFGEPPQHPNVKSLRYEIHFRNAWHYVWKEDGKEGLLGVQWGAMLEDNEQKRIQMNELRQAIQRCAICLCTGKNRGDP